MAKGRIIYVPPILIEELDNVMKEERLTVKTEGFRKIVNYSRLGRQINSKTKDNLVIPINLNSKKNIRNLLRL